MVDKVSLEFRLRKIDETNYLSDEIKDNDFISKNHEKTVVKNILLMKIQLNWNDCLLRIKMLNIMCHRCFQ